MWGRYPGASQIKLHKQINLGLDLQGGIHLVKPNLEELSELLKKPVTNDPEKLISAARTLCDRVQIILVSLGAEGAVMVNKDTAIHAKAVNLTLPVVNTVGCGDYLLAGYLAGSHLDMSEQLAAAVKAATAKALALVETSSWPQVQEEIDIEIHTYR